MSRVIEHFAADHRACDEVFAQAEKALGEGDQPTASRAFARFRILLEAHFGAEEEVVFPAFEALTGLTNGPTNAMRAEHRQMLMLCEDTQRCIDSIRLSDAAGLADTLFSLVQAHNMKEEQVLYPMCDDALGAHPEVVAEAIARLGRNRSEA